MLLILFVASWYKLHSSLTGNTSRSPHGTHKLFTHTHTLTTIPAHAHAGMQIHIDTCHTHTHIHTHTPRTSDAHREVCVTAVCLIRSSC